MSSILNIEDPSEWPSSLNRTLADVRPIMLAWEQDLSVKNAADFDHAIRLLGRALQLYSIRGWHCTRLTEDEADAVEACGLACLNAELVERRVAAQVWRGSMPAVIGDAVLAAHQGAARNRAGMIWFCFFPPRNAGEDGIRRLLGYWGGEAIYSAHESNSIVAASLQRLGRPCIVEVDVPVNWLSAQCTLALARLVSRLDLRSRGETDEEPHPLEGSAEHAVPGRCIRAVHRFPDIRFVALSGCNTWRVPLS